MNDNFIYVSNDRTDYERIAASNEPIYIFLDLDRLYLLSDLEKCYSNIDISDCESFSEWLGINTDMGGPLSRVDRSKLNEYRPI